MWWLLFVAPVAVVVIYFLTEGRETRRTIEINLWRKAAGNPRKVTSMPGALARILRAAGGGAPVGYYELAPKLAYLAVMGADSLAGSEHATLVAKLDEPGPTFCVRPLPILEGERVANTGVLFKKDEEFMEEFLVERSLDGEPGVAASDTKDKAIRKWLSPPVREALLELTDAWLRVDAADKTMALTIYGLPDADKIEALIATADIIFAEYGAGGGPSLLLDDAAGAAAAAEEEEEEEEEDEDEDEDDEDEDEDDDVLNASPAKKPAAKPAPKPAPTKPAPAKAAVKPAAPAKPAASTKAPAPKR